MLRTSLHITGVKLEDNKKCKTFDEVKKVISDVNKAINDEHDIDKKCQWFILCIMRLVDTKDHFSSQLLVLN